MLYYASFNPYGITVKNTDGNRANAMCRFDTRRQRDAWVADDPTHRERVSARSPYVRDCKAEAPYTLWPVPYFERRD